MLLRYDLILLFERWVKYGCYPEEAIGHVLDVGESCSDASHT